MMYLPYKSDQEAEARQLMVEMFELVFPQERAKVVVKKYVKLIYDPATHELTQIVMPFITMSEVTTLTLDKGWVTKASVEDVKLLPGVHRTMYRDFRAANGSPAKSCKMSRAGGQSSFSLPGTWSGRVCRAPLLSTTLTGGW